MKFKIEFQFHKTLITRKIDSFLLSTILIYWAPYLPSNLLHNPIIHTHRSLSPPTKRALIHLITIILLIKSHLGISQYHHS